MHRKRSKGGQAFGDNRAKIWRTSSHFDLPAWMQDNEFLHSYHRPQLQSVTACFASVLRLHSETGNIWTHLIGFIIVSYYAINDLTNPDMHLREKLMFGVSYVSSLTCLSCSTLFHTLNCHSPQMAKRFNKLDYAGIVIMICGSFSTWLYYMFYCIPLLQCLYTICVAGFGCGTLVMSLMDRFCTPQYRVVRASFFVTFGLFGLAPAANTVWLYGMDMSMARGIGWCALMAICYVVGAGIYATRVPERFLPGKCDVMLHSHQLLHILVLLGMAAHYGCKRLSEHVMENDIASDCFTDKAMLYHGRQQ